MNGNRDGTGEERRREATLNLHVSTAQPQIQPQQQPAAAGDSSSSRHNRNNAGTPVTAKTTGAITRRSPS